MKKDKYKYFRVPVNLLQGLTESKEETLLNCAYYGVYSLTQTKKVTEKDEQVFIEQFVYAYYNAPDTLTAELMEKMDEYTEKGMFTPDLDHNGFTTSGSRKLNVDNEMYELDRIFYNDIEFKDMAVDFGKLKDAFNFYGIDLDFCKLDWIKKMEIPDNSPMLMIPQIKLNEFLSDDAKTEFDLMTFATYLAIRSILGTKPYCRTTKEMILARAFGFRKMDELKQNTPPLFTKYSNRYWIDKLLVKVRKWNIHIYSTSEGLRGMYIGNGAEISEDYFLDIIAKEQFSKDIKTKNQSMKKRLAEKIEKLKNEEFNR